MYNTTIIMVMTFSFTFEEPQHLQKCTSNGESGWTSTGFLNGKKIGNLSKGTLYYISFLFRHMRELSICLMAYLNIKPLPAEHVWCFCRRLDTKMDVFIQDGIKVASESCFCYVRLQQISFRLEKWRK